MTPLEEARDLGAALLRAIVSTQGAEFAGAVLEAECGRNGEQIISEVAALASAVIVAVESVLEPDEVRAILTPALDAIDKKIDAEEDAKFGPREVPTKP